MEQDKIVRAHLISLLEGGGAHMKIDEATKDFPVSEMNTLFPKGTYSSWGLLEHIRASQWDILDFIRNPDYKEMDWPSDYWPGKGKKATKNDWDNTLKAIDKDNEALKAIVKDSKTDLYAKIKWGTGQTIFREMLVVADHKSYHLGELAIMRQTMGTWGKNREKD